MSKKYSKVLSTANNSFYSFRYHGFLLIEIFYLKLLKSEKILKSKVNKKKVLESQFER